MSNHNKEWTDREDQVIIRELNSGEHKTMKEAFIAATKQLKGRSRLACSNRYYSAITKSKNGKQSNSETSDGNLSNKDKLVTFMELVFDDTLSKQEQVEFINKKIKQLTS